MALNGSGSSLFYWSVLLALFYISLSEGGNIKWPCYLLNIFPKITMVNQLFIMSVLNFQQANAWHSLGQMAPVKQRYYAQDRKSTRLNSSHVAISYAVFC